jgi:hypothetical protein
MSFNINEANPVLKTVYLPPVREVLNNATPLLKYVEKEIQEVPGGSGFVIPLHVGRNDSAGDGAGGKRHPPRGWCADVQQDQRRPRSISTLGCACRVRSSRQRKNNKGAFLKALETEMKYLMQDTKRAFNRQMHGDGT